MNITEFLKQNILYLDGGMGTLLQSAGLAPGELPERWNLTHPDVIRGIHADYFRAGSNVVNANTFGANLLKFSHEELESIIRAAMENAHTAAKMTPGDAPRWVALDIGPTGRMLKPYGDLDFEDAVKLFAETVRLGVKYGADLIMIETMNDSYETRAALLAAKENSTLPVFVSNAYGEDGKLMTGATPAAMVAMLEGMGADAVGVNCSMGPASLSDVIDEYLACASVPVLFKPNAGLPQMREGKTVFDVTPDLFAAEMAAAIARGVRVAGGCCGTAPAHILGMVEASQDLDAKPITPKNDTVISSYTHALRFGEHPVLIGERINPTGKKRLKEALRVGDIDYILNEGITQEEKGVHALDVNVGLPEINEAEMLPRVVTSLQAVTSLPLQIDTSDPIAMENALRRYNGKALVNSVNGKEESIKAVFPLVKKYGGVVIALTLDENGIPDTAEGRLAIARRILSRAADYGIDKKDIVFDPLTLTVSADPTAALTALESVRRIGAELGCHTSLGVSNVSFGLPARDAVNSTFFAMALASGLSAAILNPNSDAMMSVYHSDMALTGKDESCRNYIAFASKLPQNAPKTDTLAPAVPPENSPNATTALGRAVISGLRESAANACREMLAEREPLSIIETVLIPALNTVGEGYEQKRVYLPQLLMSAEAASAAFEVIRSSMPAEKAPTGRTVVLATVKGDIHDIGKNIVKMLLENYGFTVRDLGKDVPPEVIADEVERLHAPFAGLSALMTTTVPFMEETVKLLKKRTPWCKIVVGGAVLTEEYAARMGADAYAADAMATVRFCRGERETVRDKE